MRLSSGKGREIDVIGAAGAEVWVCQSKWLTNDKVGIPVLKELVSQGEMVREEMESLVIRLWIFAFKGLTNQAVKYAQEHEILWSSAQEFNNLLEFVGLRKLPEL